MLFSLLLKWYVVFSNLRGMRHSKFSPFPSLYVGLLPPINFDKFWQILNIFETSWHCYLTKSFHFCQVCMWVSSPPPIKPHWLSAFVCFVSSDPSQWTKEPTMHCSPRQHQFCSFGFFKTVTILFSERQVREKVHICMYIYIYR